MSLLLAASRIGRQVNLNVRRLYYPNGNSAADTANVLLLVQHWYRQTNRPIPSQLLGVACPQPVF